MMMAIMDKTLTRSTRKETKLEPVFVKHYAPNICLPLKMAKFAQFPNFWGELASVVPMIGYN